MDTTERLVIDLPKELVDKLRERVASGEFQSESQVVEAVLKSGYYGGEPDEEQLQEIRAAIAEAEADIAAGRVYEADDVHAKLRAIIKENTTRRT
jgi:Arc/MetJ-type ribon-helix-helix transcriptional regulator